MFCSKCGKEISNNARFCIFCGEKVFYEEKREEADNLETSEKISDAREERAIIENELSIDEQQKAMRKSKLITVSGLIIFGVVAIILFLFLQKQGANILKTETNTSIENNEPVLQLHNVTQDEIDIYAENRQPNTRDYSLSWDSTLFYTLEDIGPDEEDGKIEKYSVSRKELLNKQNGNQIEYEIYTNPDTGKMNKIVSIENMGDYLEITDYYYHDNGQPNFIYQRTDSIYTPTYATPDKTGERFYFNNDILVKWRWIDIPSQIEEIVLSTDEASSAQIQYLFDDVVSNQQTDYNQKEVQMLNAAYNTYEAMEKSLEYGNVKGYILDSEGNPLSDVTIKFLTENGTIGQVNTDENGYYETGISLNESGYKLEISCESYINVNVYNVIIEKANVTNWIENIYLSKEEEKSFFIQLNIYDADTVFYNDDKTISKSGISNTTVNIRKGISNTSGEIMEEGISDSNGYFAITLDVGVYTVETKLDGYTTNYITLQVDEDKKVEIPMVSQLSDNQLKVVLSWEGDADLDSFLFTPYKSDKGDMAYINATNNADEYGNSLNLDSKGGSLAEIINISDSNNGTYKYYVSDYNNCIKGNFSATDMRNLNIRVTIYDKNGVVTVYTIPYSFTGVIWEVFEIKNGKIVTLQHTYSNLEGKSWWSEDKNLVEKNREAKQAYYDVFKNGVKPEGLESLTYEQFCAIGTGQEFTLIDIDNDGIDELLIGEAITDVTDYTAEGWLGKINFILKFDDSKVKVLLEDVMDYTSGSAVLNNGNYAVSIMSMGGHFSLPSNSTVTDDMYNISDSIFKVWNSLEDYLNQATCEEYRLIQFLREENINNLEYEYYINNVIVSDDEWTEAVQNNIIDKLISKDKIYILTDENLIKVLLSEVESKNSDTVISGNNIIDKNREAKEGYFDAIFNDGLSRSDFGLSENNFSPDDDIEDSFDYFKYSGVVQEYVLRDFDNDGIEEMFIGQTFEAGFNCFGLDYIDGKVSVFLPGWITDSDVYLLNDNTLCYTESDETIYIEKTSENEEYIVEEKHNSFYIYQLQTDGTKREIVNFDSLIKYSKKGTSGICHINGEEVSIEELERIYQKYIGNNLIPWEEVKFLSIEHFQQELLEN